MLFLNNYQDQSPIAVDTELQSKPTVLTLSSLVDAMLSIGVGIKMDWSSPGEILAVGGHKRVNESTCSNQIIFYSRRGEFLHRVHIPQTVSDFLTTMCTSSALSEVQSDSEKCVGIIMLAT